MSNKLNSTIDTLKKLSPIFFDPQVKFNDPLNQEILNDTALWANLLMDSFPETIAKKLNIFRIINEDIIGGLILNLLESENSKDNFISHIYNLEAEQSFLGCVMFDYRLFFKYEQVLNEDDFYFERNRAIFSIMKSLQNSESESAFSFNPATVFNEIKKQNRIQECGGEEYIFDLLNNVSSTENINKYCEILIEKSKLRKLECLARSIMFFSKNIENKNVDEFLTELTNSLKIIETNRGMFSNIKKIDCNK
jgi:hypothetical protein